MQSLSEEHPLKPILLQNKERIVCARKAEKQFKAAAKWVLYPAAGLFLLAVLGKTPDGPAQMPFILLTALSYVAAFYLMGKKNDARLAWESALSRNRSMIQAHRAGLTPNP